MARGALVDGLRPVRLEDVLYFDRVETYP